MGQRKLTEINESKKEEYIIADHLAKDLRHISVSEFFQKNKQFLGYDNPTKALLTVVKEGCDNSLDACQEARILPEILVEIKQLSENRFKIVVEDNGPGIVKKYVPNIFGTLLYGSKFHRLKQNRGILGVGISGAVLYAQLTTGKPAKITSKYARDKPAYYCELQINAKNNEPELIKEEEIAWDKAHGVRIDFEVEANYQKGARSVDEYLKQTAIVNPNLHLTYVNPAGEKIEFPRATEELPKETREIKPHPYGVELGILISMLKDTKARTMQSFLMNDFCRVSAKVAKEICEKANIPLNARPSRIAKEEADNLLQAIRKTKIMAPPTDCLSPIGEELLSKGLKKEINADFYAAVTRPPSVYRGFPFIIEAGLVYGGDTPADDLVRLYRFANRVPLLYQQSGCAITKSVINTAWRNYGLTQSKGALPTGPVIIVVHIASVWVPFTSESKEAIASFPEIIKEVKLALQECGRKLLTHIRKHVRAKEQKERANLFEKYIPELAEDLGKLTKEKKTKIEEGLKKMLKRHLPLILEQNDKKENK